MAVAPVAWFAILIFGVVLAIGLAGIILLIAYPKTRPVGIGLLVVGPMVLAGLFMGLFFVRARTVIRETPAVQVHFDASGNSHYTQVPALPPQMAEEIMLPPPVVPVSSPAAVPEPKPLSTVEAMGHAIRNALDSPWWTRSEEARKQAEAEEKLAADRAQLDTHAELPLDGSPESGQPVEKKPAWITRPPQVMDGTYQMVVAVGPYSTRSECDAAMADKLQEATANFAAAYLLIDQRQARELRLPLHYLRSNVVKEEYAEPIQSSVGPMIKLHALLQFDHGVRSQLDQEWTQLRQTRRLWGAGGGLASVLLLLSVAYGYLRADIATKGAYRWRLRLLTGVTLLALTLLGLSLIA